MRCSWIKPEVRQRIGLVGFAVVFTLIYLALHLLVFGRYAVFLGRGGGTAWWWPAFGGALLYPVAFTWEKLASGVISRWVYGAASIEMGVWWIALGWLIPYEAVRAMITVPEPAGGVVLVVLVLATVIYAMVQGLRIRVLHLPLRLSRLDGNIRLVHLTDIHCGTIHRERFLRKIVERVNALDPELILITGDLFDGSGPVDGEMLRPLDALRAPAYFTTGNHENYEGLEKVMRVLGGVNLRVLRNEVAIAQGIQIVGVDNPSDDRSGPAEVLRGLSLDSSLPTVLMFHIPRGMEQAAAAGVHLQLSGHSHWGQMFPFDLLVRLFYPHGFGYSRHGEDGGLQLYCAPGTGTWGPPMRLGSRNQITVLELSPDGE